MKTGIVLLLACLMPCFSAAQMTPVTTDSRIKTFVYNENDVYNLLTYYGYQSNVEFGNDEKIETVSIGDRVGWQLVPAGRRLFIRALSDNLHTNMTLVTNQRAYQFDLRSANPANLAKEELVYVARFFYPDDKKNSRPAAQSPVPNPSALAAPIASAVAAAPNPAISVAPVAPLTIAKDTAAPAVQQPPVAPAKAANSTPAPSANYNYNYTYTGSGYLVPMGMFDDGRYTYFQFVQGAAIPEIFVVDVAGNASPANGQMHQGYYVIGRTAAQFVLRLGNDKANLFNESFGKK